MAESSGENPMVLTREIALRRLSQRDYSRAELAQALGRRQVPPDVIEALLDRFEELGLVDDLRYAQNWARSKQATRKLSQRMIRLELSRRGLAPEIIDQAVSEMDPESDYQTALDLGRRKLRGLSRVEPAIARRRLGAALTRRGYPGDLIAKVVAEVLLEATQEELPDQMY